ncbi:MAG: 2-oxoglutarate dehydrogenase, subunit, partial [Frankiales bacterium]|nr:2-oxoglutarate dehydrogenase, subunit [Frankiales bacterium]
MSTQPGQQTDFGANEWLVYEIHQQYLKDPASVSAEWQDFLSDYSPGDSPAPNGASHGAGTNGASAPPAEAAPADPAPLAAGSPAPVPSPQPPA